MNPWETGPYWNKCWLHTRTRAWLEFCTFSHCRMLMYTLCLLTMGSDLLHLVMQCTYRITTPLLTHNHPPHPPMQVPPQCVLYAAGGCCSEAAGSREICGLCGVDLCQPRQCVPAAVYFCINCYLVTIEWANLIVVNMNAISSVEVEGVRHFLECPHSPCLLCGGTFKPSCSHFGS